MKRIREFFIIMMVSFVGEVLKYVIPLPIPAGIYGLLLLFVLLMTKKIKLQQVEKTADFLVEVMPFFFIPAGVGLMTKWPELTSMLPAFFVDVLFITVLVMVVSGRVTQYLIRRNGGKKDE